jgi:pimeloyl-ACP methyl ester carboxylesterase
MSEFKDHFFQAQDGLTLYSRDYAGPNENAPAVVCLHGLTRNSKDFQDLAPALTDHFRVLVPEQRGRGRSDWDHDVSRYALLQYVQDMHDLLTDLQIARLAVVGTSMGGLMTFALNALHPGLVTRRVINDIGPEIAEVGLNRIKSYVGAVGPFADWNEATAYLKSASVDIFPDWRDPQWAAFARQCYIEHDGQVVIDYDPRIAEPLTAESNDTEADTLWSLFAAMSSVPSLLIAVS